MKTTGRATMKATTRATATKLVIFMLAVFLVSAVNGWCSGGDGLDCMSLCLERQSFCTDGLTCPDPHETCEAACKNQEYQNPGGGGCFVLFIGGVPRAFCWG